MGRLLLTSQRRSIREAVGHGGDHPSADEVFQRVRKKLPTISLSTVYRNLDWMACKGWIRKVEVAGGKMRFDGNPNPHYHVRCISCGELKDVQIEHLHSYETIVESSTHFKILGHVMEFFGLCPRCQGRPDS
jgi:Fur family ferric uptake transcriptional regulator